MIWIFAGVVALLCVASKGFRIFTAIGAAGFIVVLVLAMNAKPEPKPAEEPQRMATWDDL